MPTLSQHYIISFTLNDSGKGGDLFFSLPTWCGLKSDSVRWICREFLTACRVLVIRRSSICTTLVAISISFVTRPKLGVYYRFIDFLHLWHSRHRLIKTKLKYITYLYQLKNGIYRRNSLQFPGFQELCANGVRILRLRKTS